MIFWIVYKDDLENLHHYTDVKFQYSCYEKWHNEGIIVSRGEDVLDIWEDYEG